MGQILPSAVIPAPLVGGLDLLLPLTDSYVFFASLINNEII